MKTPSQPLVMIVEDNDLIVECITHHLEQANFAVLPAYSIAEALEILPSQQPHVILMDVILDDGKGFDLCQLIRNGGEDAGLLHVADTPILFLSARADEVDRLEGFQCGADDYMTKPFSPQELVYRVQALIRRSHGQSHACIDVGQIHIDPRHHEIRVGSSVVQLSPKEFDLLYVLARQPGMVISRNELFDRVWGSRYLGNSRTVDVHVNRVRQKLGSFKDTGIALRSIWGVGYRLVTAPMGL